MVMIYYYFDNLDLFNKKDYLEDKSRRSLLSRPQYITGFTISALLGAYMFTDAYQIFLNAFWKIDVIFPRLLSALTVIVIRLIQLHSLKSKWDGEIDHPLFAEKSLFKRNRDPYTFKSYRLFLQPLGYVAVFYIVCLITTSYIIKYAIALIIIIAELWKPLLVIVIIPFIVLFSFRIIYNLNGRRKLIRRLNRLKRQKHAEVKFIGYKYLSSFLTFLPLQLVVTTSDGEIFKCDVITCDKVNAPMFMNSEEYIVEHGFHLRSGALLSKGGRFAQAVDISAWGGNTNPTNLIFGFRKSSKFTFPSGEDMGNYTVYTATGFANMIERSIQ